jgi:hypothetical protein
VPISITTPLSLSFDSNRITQTERERACASRRGRGGGAEGALVSSQTHATKHATKRYGARARVRALSSLAQSLFSLPLTHSLALPLFRLLAYVAPSQSLSRSRSRRHTPPPDPRLRLPPERGLSEYAKPCPPPLPFPCPWHSSSASDGFMHTLPAACA